LNLFRAGRITKETALSYSPNPDRLAMQLR